MTWDKIQIFGQARTKSKIQVPITSQPESQIQIGVWIWPVNYYLSNEHAFEYHDFTTKKHWLQYFELLRFVKLYFGYLKKELVSKFNGRRFKGERHRSIKRG